jgi:hypothetical protein
LTTFRQLFANFLPTLSNFFIAFSQLLVNFFNFIFYFFYFTIFAFRIGRDHLLLLTVLEFLLQAAAQTAQPSTTTSGQCTPTT